MIPILTEILTSNWLIHDERKEAYAAILMSLLKGERISEGSYSAAREKNRSYVTSRSMVQRWAFSSAEIPDGSIAVIPIRSEIMKYDQQCGPRGTLSITEEIKAADQNPKIKSILLVVDSPGGQVTHADILSDEIRNCKTKVIAFVEGMAASAAYWIISGASKIIASSENDEIGSIGTMLFFADLKPYYEDMGVKFHEFYATKSTDKNKDVNDVLDGKYDDYRKNKLDPINERFHAAVKRNRPGVDASAFTGKIYFANDAISLGLIDEIGSMDYAIEQADIELQGETDLQGNFNDNNSKSLNMKITQKLSAIWGILFGTEEKAEEKEITPENLQSLNEKISQLEKGLNDEKSAREKAQGDLSAANSALAETTRQYEALKASDAAGETGAKKVKDQIGASEDPSANYAHNKIADRI